MQTAEAIFDQIVKNASISLREKLTLMQPCWKLYLGECSFGDYPLLNENLSLEGLETAEILPIDEFLNLWNNNGEFTHAALRGFWYRPAEPVEHHKTKKESRRGIFDNLKDVMRHKALHPIELNGNPFLGSPRPDAAASGDEVRQSY